jgi:hypothetical protein
VVKIETPPRRGVVLGAALSLVVLLVVLVVVLPGGSRRAAPTGRTPTPTPQVTDPGGTSPQAPIDPAAPFAGSQAAGWESGIAGLAMPPAKPVPGFSAAEVAEALELAKRHVELSRLDRQAIAGGRPRALLALLDPTSVDHAILLEQLRKPTQARSVVHQVTRFDPAETRLHGSEIKLKGTATVVPSPSGDEFGVVLEYAVVYAVRRVGATPPEIDRVMIRQQAELSTYRSRAATPGTVWIAAQSDEAVGVHCDVADGFLHPVYESEPERADDADCA